MLRIVAIDARSGQTNPRRVLADVPFPRSALDLIAMFLNAEAKRNGWLTTYVVECDEAGIKEREPGE